MVAGEGLAGGDRAHSGEPSDLQLLLDLYEVSRQHRERLTELGRTARQRGWWDAYADMLGPEYATLIALESDADSAGWYAAQIVPGLLQTEEYAREIIRSTLLISPPGEMERRVQVRMSRQRVLSGDSPLELAVILDEAALERQVGGAAVMRTQLCHLVRSRNSPMFRFRCSRTQRARTQRSPVSPRSCASRS